MLAWICATEPGLAPDFSRFPYSPLNRFLPFFCLFFGVLCRSFVINKKRTVRFLCMSDSRL